MHEQLDLFAPVSADSPGAAAAQIPPDQAARTLVAEALDTTLFVEAGAGSGKTTALVARVVNLVRSGVPIGSIAAITFTEKAAAELRHRTRDSLQHHRLGAATAPEQTLLDAALIDLDHAPIGTLHAFARRLLGEFPLESQLPPRFDVLDEVQSATAFHDRFTDLLEALLDDPQSVRLVELCEYDRFSVERGVRQMADDFQSNWDLVEERVGAHPPPRAEPDLDDIVARCAVIAEVDVPPGDTQEKTVAVIRSASTMIAAAPGLTDVLHALEQLAGLKGSGGNKQNWKRHGAPGEALPKFRESLLALAAAARIALNGFNEERRFTLGALLRAFTLGSVAERQNAGQLEFHDLLVFARRLVAGHPRVRAELHRRYTRLLLDEFQDTDPIQLELAVRITADPTIAASDWRRIQPLPGRLCVVGDPKQSIYRFRRADIGQFLRARDQIGASTATLSANFRSTPAVIDWVNHTMAELIRADPDVQPAYQPLDACRPGAGTHGSVTVLGSEAHPDSPTADELRRREAVDVAGAAVQALVEGWPVQEASGHGLGAVLRPCRPGDIAILVPSRTSLPALQDALAARGLSFRAENSSLVYAAPEVRALMLALRAADDPTDELAVVSTLRSQLYGCSDRHLYDWRVVHGQTFGWRADVSDDLVGHPVEVGLRSLGRLSTSIPTSTPAELLSTLVDERAVYELALAEPQHSRDVWRRIRFVVDQARAWSEAGGHGVRRYLQWTRLQGDDGRFVAETVLPETDHDAIRIMTVHAAKGLEFPIAIVSGMTTKQRGNRGRRVVWPPGTWTLSDPTDGVYEQFAPVDESMSNAERKRLLYVATTRAQDHLVVSLHRVAKENTTSAWWLATASAGAAQTNYAGGDHRLPPPATQSRELPWADEEHWATERAVALLRASRPSVLSATALAGTFATTPDQSSEDQESAAAPEAGGDADAGGIGADPGLQKDAVDLDLPPWQRGRYGTAVGRAVHAVLQHADLRDGTDIAVLADAQAAAEAVLGLERTVERLARSALQTDIVSTGCRTAHWRELFVATAFGGHVVEGYIDLLVRHPTRGLVVVDYKTDQLADATDRVQRLRRYGVQLAAYGIALEELLGEPVNAGILVLCTTSGPAGEFDVPDWSSVKAALRARLLTQP